MIFKPGNSPTDVTSYRPIRLLPIMGKVSERLLLNRTEETVPLNKLIPPYQFGFREDRSTAQQCHIIINKISDSLVGEKIVLQFSLTCSRSSIRSGRKVYYTS
jgi:hypothetical protein